MTARLRIICLIAVAATLMAIMPCSELTTATCEGAIAATEAAVVSTSQAERGITGQATVRTVGTPQIRSARLIIETGVAVQTLGSTDHTRSVTYEHAVGSRHRLSLMLCPSDSMEWGLTAVHLPGPGITTMGAAVRLRVLPEISATVDISGSLLTSSPIRGILPGFGWGASLEWQRVVDPLALTAQIGYAGHSTESLGLASVGGSVSLLVNDYISLSGSGSISWSGMGAVVTQLGASVAYQRSSADTVYVTVQASLSPSDSFVATLGMSHELR